MKKKTDIKKVLKERGSNYGSFAGHAKISQDIKRAMRSAPGWERLDDDMKECLEMEAHKNARILNGKKPKYLDSWVDKVGYNQLVINRLEGVKSE